MRLFMKRRYLFRRIRPYKKRNNTFNKVLTISLIFMFLLYSSILFEKRIKPTIITMAKVKAVLIATSTINETINDIIEKNSLTYEELVLLQKNSAGEIIALQADVVKMNRIKSDFSLDVQKRIEKIDTTKIGVPIGNIINSQMLSGWGPKIPIRLIPAGIIKADFKSGFEAAGINQTKHEIIIEVTGKINILLPVVSASSEVTTTVPVAHTVLIGTVPKQYINIEGTTISLPDTIQGAVKQ